MQMLTAAVEGLDRHPSTYSRRPGIWAGATRTTGHRRALRHSRRRAALDARAGTRARVHSCDVKDAGATVYGLLATTMKEAGREALVAA